VVAINHTCASIEDVIYQIFYDSTHGPLSASILSPKDIFAVDRTTLSVRGHLIYLSSQRDPKLLDWNASGAEYIIESTGKSTTADRAGQHVEFGGAKGVLISAPSNDAPTFVCGVNTRGLAQTHTSTLTHIHNRIVDPLPRVLSCASCTTNCLAPLAKILDDNFGIVQGLMTTVHASTKSQPVLDGYSKRGRRLGRAVLGNVIPTTTGAASAVSAVLPQLTGKLTGISLRVPTYVSKVRVYGIEFG